MATKRNKINKNEDLSLTKQQKFNFDSNNLEDEEEKKNRVLSSGEKIKLKKELLKLEQQKNKYKNKFIITICLFSVLLFYSSFLLYTHFKYEPKIVTKEKKVVDENIVFLGDSITDFYNLEKYYPNNNVVNSGINGNSTSDILGNMKERIYKYNPSKVFILIGTNDITAGKTVTQISKNIEKIIIKIKRNRPLTQIYLESIYPINDTNNNKISHSMVNNRKNDFIMKINLKLKTVARKQKVKYINMYDKLIDKDGNLNIEYTKEGLHMSDQGYEVITNILNRYIKK